MRAEDRKELLEAYRKAMALSPWHRLAFLAASFGAALWSLGPVFFWDQEPPVWFFIFSIGPILIYIALILPKQNRVLKDARYSTLRKSWLQLSRANLLMTWPTDDEARASPWQRPTVVLGLAVASVCILTGLGVAIVKLIG